MRGGEAEARRRKLQKYIGSPGVGISNNLWLMTADGSRFWQLTHVQPRHGALHPHFSHDGKKVVWSEIISPKLGQIGQWAIKLADFSIRDGQPHLENIQTLRPNDLQLYEMHGFSPDGRKILFSGVPQGGHYYDMEIYLMELGFRDAVRLTDNNEWDEHAHFTPDGNRIVWSSSRYIPQAKGNTLQHTLQSPPRLDLWIMNTDGSDKQRLTGFNNPRASEYISVSGGVGVADLDWSPDGKRIIAKIRRGRGPAESIVLIDLDAH
jgi:Tol biopolymer transport system component